MKIDIFDLMDSYEGNPVELKPTNMVSADRVKEKTMRIINEQNMETPIKKIRSGVLIAALVAALCLGTTALAVTTNVFDGLIGFISANSEFGRDDSTGEWALTFTGEISAGKQLNYSTTNADIVLIDNDGDAWTLSKDQTIHIGVGIQGDGTKTGIGVGYAYCDDKGEFISTTEIVCEQIIDSGEYTFTVPEDGNYFFYFANVSAGQFDLIYFTVE